jgi:hypothetical protein
MRIVIALAFVAACTHGYTVEDYWADLGEMHCQRMVDCCTAAEYQDWWTADSTGDTYSCLQTWQHPPDEYEVTQAIDRGTVHFDAAAAHICVQVLQDLSCSEFEPAFRYRETYCESPLHGTIRDGDSCRTDAECTSTLCAISDPTSQVGTCRPRMAEGATCDITSTAQPGNCTAPDGCQQGTCGLGMLPGTECTSDWQCVDHWCKGAGLFQTGHCIKACDGK